MRAPTFERRLVFSNTLWTVERGNSIRGWWVPRKRMARRMTAKDGEMVVDDSVNH